MERAAIADDPVDVTRFEFEEFRSFAESANHMLAARKKSEAQFRLLLENSPVATLISDLEGRARFVNNSFVSLFGYSLEEVSTAERWFQLAFPDESYRAELLDEWQRAFKDACDKDGLFGGKEVRIRCADGVERDVFVSASLYTDRLIVHFQDRTEQKHAEEILRQSQKMEAMGQLAGGVAHDFNNMLGGIIGAAELLKRRVPENPEATKYTSMILEAAGRAAGLTEKLLVFSRKQTVEAVPVDLHAILRDVVAILENSIDKRVAIELDLSANESVVVGDVAQLQAVFLNLGINAAHAMPEGGRLSFRTHARDLAEADRRLFELKPGRYIEVEVADTGSGIPPEILPRIFEPFFTTKEPGKGTGLGLSAAFGAVQQHGGSIKVYSDVGIGTCFRVLLPLTCDVGVRPTPVPAYFSGKGLVLVVDDEKIMRDTARALLEDVGYRVLLADDGCQALEVFRSRLGEIDWVILDMVMPCMNGKDCFFAMRSLQPDVRIVLSSGLIGGDDLDEMMAAGLTGVIRKPFRSAELYRALEGDREG
jgi:two-component system cell cycle sensor histidine kinase/response regulator CckA